MNWQRQGNASRAVSDTDYVVTWSREGDRLLFTAWGPAIGQIKLNRLIKAHYERGEQVPTERELIGCFLGSGAGEKAKQACERHWDGKHGL